jgi:aspartate aminotransferase-like enzyme/GNAT superfamily N-acetyltransferase
MDTIYKIADQDWELQQVHRLNYRTFVKEIPQHPPGDKPELVDRFDQDNIYLIALRGRQLAGMVVVRGIRPFSLDSKLQDLGDYLPSNRHICELRMLSIEKQHRGGKVFFGLAQLLLGYCKEHGFDCAVISGTVRQLKLYHHLGFKDFGPLVGTPQAFYQPMWITIEEVEKRLRRKLPMHQQKQLINLLPGPADIDDTVMESFSNKPVSHRGSSFRTDFERICKQLCELANAKHVAIMMGSGTLANDAVAGQLSRLPGRGLVLANGEFGQRLIDHASRAGLQFDTISESWGMAFSRHKINRQLSQQYKYAWIWATHCETSTGMLNDMRMLKEVAASNRVKLVLDCISSLGTIPVDLADVYMATAVSGKGLRSIPGLAMLFYHHNIAPDVYLPRYLDIGYYAAKNGIPFTISSNLVYALGRTLDELHRETRFAHVARLSSWVRRRLSERGHRIITADRNAAPGVITIALPLKIDSRKIGDRLAALGYLLSYASEYLLQRNWIQICLMGDYSQEKLSPLLDELWDIMWEETEQEQLLTPSQLAC